MKRNRRFGLASLIAIAVGGCGGGGTQPPVGQQDMFQSRSDLAQCPTPVVRLASNQIDQDVAGNPKQMVMSVEVLTSVATELTMKNNFTVGGTASAEKSSWVLEGPNAINPKDVVYGAGQVTGGMMQSQGAAYTTTPGKTHLFSLYINSTNFALKSTFNASMLGPFAYNCGTGWQLLSAGFPIQGATFTYQSSCGDGKVNGPEADVDCGGGSLVGQPGCSLCGVGKNCGTPGDCATLSCSLASWVCQLCRNDSDCGVNFPTCDVQSGNCHK